MVIVMQVMSIARGVTLKGMDDSHKVVELTEAMKARDKSLVDLEGERDLAKTELRKARHELGPRRMRWRS